MLKEEMRREKRDWKRERNLGKIGVIRENIEYWRNGCNYRKGTEREKEIGKMT